MTCISKSPLPDDVSVHVTDHDDVFVHVTSPGDVPTHVFRTRDVHISAQMTCSSTSLFLLMWDDWSIHVTLQDDMHRQTFVGPLACHMTSIRHGLLSHHTVDVDVHVSFQGDMDFQITISQWFNSACGWGDVDVHATVGHVR